MEVSTIKFDEVFDEVKPHTHALLFIKTPFELHVSANLLDLLG